MQRVTEAEVFEQPGYRCRLAWGRRGSRTAAARGDLLVVVDVLSFSSAVATAAERGGIIYPCAAQDLDRVAREAGATAAVARTDVPGRGRFSLSPCSFQAIEPGEKVALASPNGAMCSVCGDRAARLFVGALLNARAVARAVSESMAETGLPVTVLACGERWTTPSEDGDLRFAVEDYLGAGAILAGLPGEKSPEARVCESAFRAVEDDLPAILADCASGRELRARGYAEDVRVASCLDAYKSVPVWRDGRLEGV